MAAPEQIRSSGGGGASGATTSSSGGGGSSSDLQTLVQQVVSLTQAVQQLQASNHPLAKALRAGAPSRLGGFLAGLLSAALLVSLVW